MKDEEDNNSSEEQNIETPAITVKVSEGPSVSEDSWQNNEQPEVIQTVEEVIEKTPETVEVVETVEETPAKEEEKKDVIALFHASYAVRIMFSDFGTISNGLSGLTRIERALLRSLLSRCLKSIRSKLHGLSSQNSFKFSEPRMEVASVILQFLSSRRGGQFISTLYSGACHRI